MARRFVRRMGEQISGWILVKELGAGGNAEVWRAKSAGGDEVALKILRQKDADSEPYARFRAEIEVLRSVGELPGVLKLIDASLPDTPSKTNPAWIAFPVATGVRRALGVQPSLRAVVEAIAEFANTLATLAMRDIFHRDIKPENLYKYDQRWVVGDFGLVDYPDKAGLTATGTLIGPFFYLAPELLNNSANVKSGPLDVYSLAKTMWVLATGQNYPLPGHLTRQVQQLRLSSYVPDERSPILDALLERATEFEPEQRPGMRDFASELEAWLSLPSPPPAQANLYGLQEFMQNALLPHTKAKTVFQDCERHVERTIELIRQKLTPIAEDLRMLTRFDVQSLVSVLRTTS